MKRTLALILAVLLAAVHVSFAEEYEQSGCWTKIYVQDEFGDPTGEAYFVAEAKGTCTSASNPFGAPIKATVIVTDSAQVGFYIFNQNGEPIINTTNENIKYNLKIKDGQDDIYTFERGAVMDAESSIIHINYGSDEYYEAARRILAGGKVRFAISNETDSYSFALENSSGLEPFLPVYSIRAGSPDGVCIVSRVGSRLCGLMDAKGQFLTPCKYSDIEYMGEGLFMTRRVSDDKCEYVFIDETGCERFAISASSRTAPSPFSEGLSLVMNDEYKYGMIDTNGNVILPFEYQSVPYRGWAMTLYEFNDGLAAVCKKGYGFGYVDAQGNEVVPCKYDGISEFIDGLAAVTLDGKHGYVDQQGNEVVPCKYDDTTWFTDGLAAVSLDGKYGLVDTQGNEIVPCKYDYKWMFNKVTGIGRVIIGDGLCVVSLDGKFGYIDAQGNEVVPCIYDRASKFVNGAGVVSLNGKYGCIDTQGNEIVPCVYDKFGTFSEGLAAVSADGKYGYIDMQGNLVIPCRFDYADAFSEGLAAVSMDGLYGYIDPQGNEVIPCQYSRASGFSEGLAAVSTDGLYGYIDPQGNEVIPCQYSTAERFIDGIAEVSVRGGDGERVKKSINKNMQYVQDGFIIPEGYSFHHALNDELAVVSRVEVVETVDKKGKKWSNSTSYYGVIDRGGALIVPCEVKLGICLAGDYFVLGFYSADYSPLSSCGIADLEGNLLYPLEYNITYCGGSFFLIDSLKNLTVLDSQLNRIN